MSITIDLILRESQAERSVKLEHFGVNFVADWERIGSLPWERFDDVIFELETPGLRYPGGITAEQGFDITAPNAPTIDLASGATRQIMGAYDFAEFARTHGLSATFIIPTIQMMIEDPATGELVFNPKMAGYIQDFVLQTLISTGGHVHAFEIGNEYETYMTSREYGAFANAVAPIIGTAISDFHATNPSDAPRAGVALQVWTHFANENTTQTLADLEARALNMLDELGSDALAHIDTLVTHWYARAWDRSYAEAYHALGADIEASIDLMRTTESHAGREFDFFMSEWNADHQTPLFFGMAQAPILIRMFSEFVKNDIDHMHFWSAMYHATSLALPNGQLATAGVVMDYLSSNTIGTTVVDLDTGATDIGANAFMGAQGGVVTLSNLTDSGTTVTVSLGQITLDHQIVAIGALEVDPTNADGQYRNFTNLALHNEPDLPARINWDFAFEIDDGALSFTLTPFQTIFIELGAVTLRQGLWDLEQFRVPDLPLRPAAPTLVEFTALAHDFLMGTPGPDTLRAHDQGALVYGGAGSDMIHGGRGDDTLFGGFGHDTIMGGQGDDLIYGGPGNNRLWGGEGDDTIFGGSGNNRFGGGPGDDLLIGGTGSNTIFGGTGQDTIFGGDGPNSLWGMRGDDLIYGGPGNDRIGGGPGNDTIFGNAGNNTIYGGTGNDLLYGGTDDDIIWGGPGNDTIIGGAGNNSLNGGPGDNVLVGGTGNDTMRGGPGADTFIYMQGHQRVLIEDFTFEEQDRLVLDARLWDRAGLSPDAVLDRFGRVVADDTVLDFGGGDIVTLLGISNHAEFAHFIEIA